MPVTYSIDHGERRISQIGSGAFDCSDMSAVLDQVAAEGAWSYSTLADFRRATRVPDFADLTRTMAHVYQLAASHGERGPVAVVVPAGSELLGMIRLYSTAGERAGLNVAVFTTPEEAEHWLAARTRQPQQQP